MPGFFEKWRAWSDRFAGILVAACAILAISGGIQLIAFEGPLFAAILFIAFGVGMLVVCVISARRARRA